MFNIETFKVEEDPYKLAKEMIKAQLGKKARIIGSGVYGAVWSAKSSDIVYKIGDAENNDGYLSFIKVLAKQKTHNPFFPKIYGLRYIKRANPYHSLESTFVVAMEKLNRLKDRNNAVTSFFNNELVDDEFDDEEFDDEEYDNARKILGVKQIIPKPLKTALSVLREAKKLGNSERRFGVVWDLHEGNFMQRGNQIVITDPLS